MGRLIAAACDIADEVSIITFNHDLVIENEIDRRAKLRKLWCGNRGYGSVSAELKPLEPGAQVPKFGLHSDECEHRIQIVKPHGSLNWVHRINSKDPTAKFLAGNINTDVFLLRGKKLGGLEYYFRQGKGRQKWNLWPLVVPPIYAKASISSGSLAIARKDAKQAVLGADRLVFFGYSLPFLDVEAEKLFERGVQGNAALEEIDVVNPKPDAAARFAGIAPERRLRWYPDLDQFLAAGPL